MNLDVIELTQQLVRIPSLNPMGRDVVGPEYLETRVTQFLQQLAERLGLPWERHTVMSGRDNLLVGLPGNHDPDRTLLLLEVHQDTVPIEGMTVAPFGALLRDGRIYGRGACDVKGGMAAMWSAFAQRAAAVDPRLPNVVLACTVNEENGFDGARHLCETWQTGRSRLLPRRPDAAIVAEPTELDVIVAHKGTVRWRCHTRGRAAHSSNPAAGTNAIYRMRHVLEHLERYAQEGLPAHRTHPLLGGPTLSVGTIRGGISVNTVPDFCTIEIDRRLLPGESPSDAMQHVVDYLARHVPDVAISHDEPFLRSPGMAATGNEALAAALARAAQQLGAPGRCLGVPFGTDAGVLSAEGVPCVVFGPGSIAQAHTDDEWVAVESLERATAILREFCLTPAGTA
jgi:acetylornithine deacetylase